MLKVKFLNGIQPSDMADINNIWPNRRMGDYSIHSTPDSALEILVCTEPQSVDKSIRFKEWLRKLQKRGGVEIITL